MSVAFEYVVSAGVVGGAAALIFVGIELHLVRVLFEKKGVRINEEMSQSSRMTGGITGCRAGYAIFVLRDGGWVLDADLSKPGYEPSPPPAKLGSYDGQVVKTESQPKQPR